MRLKLSALWMSVMFLYMYGDYFTLYVPGKLEGMMAGKFVVIQTTQTVLLAATSLMIIPSVMVFLCLVLAPKLNRRVNISMGVVYSIVVVLTMFLDVWSFFLLIGLVEVALTLLIVKYAWNMPDSPSG